MNLIFVGFLVVASTGIETPLEFLFSSFLVVVEKVIGTVVVLGVVVVRGSVVCFLVVISG